MCPVSAASVENGRPRTLIGSGNRREFPRQNIDHFDLAFSATIEVPGPSESGKCRQPDVLGAASPANASNIANVRHAKRKPDGVVVSRFASARL